jgi:hypothetical protein
VGGSNSLRLTLPISTRLVQPQALGPNLCVDGHLSHLAVSQEATDDGVEDARCNNTNEAIVNGDETLLKLLTKYASLRLDIDRLYDSVVYWSSAARRKVLCPSYQHCSSRLPVSPNYLASVIEFQARRQLFCRGGSEPRERNEERAESRERDEERAKSRRMISPNPPQRRIGRLRDQ